MLVLVYFGKKPSYVPNVSYQGYTVIVDKRMIFAEGKKRKEGLKDYDNFYLSKSFSIISLKINFT